MNILIVGASRGIGLEFVKQYQQAGASVTGTARDAVGLAAIIEQGAAALTLDITNAASIAQFAKQIELHAFDLVVVNAGIYGPKTSGLDAVTQTDFDQVMHSNVLATMQLLPLLKHHFKPGAKLAVLSSRMGSIGSRQSASGWLYRASKAALNSVLKDASLCLAGQVTCIAFHPGWVQTDMGGAGADLTPAQSVAGMRQVLSGLTERDNGSFKNYDGSVIEW